MIEHGPQFSVDDMLEHAGDFGKFQYILLVLFCFINILSAFHYFGQIFISVNFDNTCDSTQSNATCSSDFYDYTSIVTELDWIGDDAWKAVLGQSCFFIGCVLGTFLFGVLADNIGRLHCLVIANVLAGVGNLTTLLSTSCATFAVTRFIAGFATDTNFVMMYILVLEYVRPSMRTFGLNMCVGLFYCLGCVIIPWLAVWVQNWRYLLILISLPHFLVLFFYLLIPESAQWLISKGHTDRAIKCFEHIARFNNKNIADNRINQLRAYCTTYVTCTKENNNFLGLLKTPKLRKKILILILKSMVMTLGYDGISRNVNGLNFSPFFVFSVTSLTIFPASVFILLVQDKIGRKPLASGALLLSGLFVTASGVIQASVMYSNPVTILTLAIIGRLGINVAYNSGHQYAVELIPTVVRAQGVSVVHVLGYVASFFSPQVIYLGNVWKPAPDVILGILLISGAVVCLFLPETLNRTLPITLQEGEEFGEDERIFDFCCYQNKTESTLELAPNSCKSYSSC